MQSMSETDLRSNRGSDASLVKRAQRGEATAWSAIVERYAGYVYTLLRSARVSEADQADAFQYVFVELFKALASLKNIDDLRPWIRQTTIRHAVKLRKAASQMSAPLDDLEFIASDVDIAESLEEADRAHTVRESVMSLSEKCRTLILKLFFEHPPRPYVEVAQALGLKQASLPMTRQRCLELLEKSLRARGIS